MCDFGTVTQVRCVVKWAVSAADDSGSCLFQPFSSFIPLTPQLEPDSAKRCGKSEEAEGRGMVIPSLQTCGGS